MVDGYEIVLQKQGKEEMVRCKVGGMAVGTDKQTGAKTSCFKLRAADGKETLPMLKVRLEKPGHPRFEVRWSNYYLAKDAEGAGRFKLVRVDEEQPLFLYVTDANSNRKLMHKGNPVIDYMAMSVRFGSTYDMETRKWEFGENQPLNEVSNILAETESIDGMLRELTDLFGEMLAEEIMVEIVMHPLFQKYVGVADTKKRRAAVTA